MRGGRRDATTEASNSLDAPRREQWLSASHLIRLVRLEPWGTRLTRPGARDRPVRHDEAHVSLQYSSGHPRLVFELGITSAVTPVIPEEIPGFSILPRSGLGTSLSAEFERDRGFESRSLPRRVSDEPAAIGVAPGHLPTAWCEFSARLLGRSPCS